MVKFQPIWDLNDQEVDNAHEKANELSEHLGGTWSVLVDYQTEEAFLGVWVDDE
jgi:hypothetical protein